MTKTILAIAFSAIGFVGCEAPEETATDPTVGETEQASTAPGYCTTVGTAMPTTLVGNACDIGGSVFSSPNCIAGAAAVGPVLYNLNSLKRPVYYDKGTPCTHTF